MVVLKIRTEATYVTISVLIDKVTGNKKLREYVHCYRDNRKSEFKFGFGRC